MDNPLANPNHPDHVLIRAAYLQSALPTDTASLAHHISSSITSSLDRGCIISSSVAVSDLGRSCLPYAAVPSLGNFENGVAQVSGFCLLFVPQNDVQIQSLFLFLGLFFIFYIFFCVWTDAPGFHRRGTQGVGEAVRPAEYASIGYCVCFLT